jgi:toxin ParE1/3/4
VNVKWLKSALRSRRKQISYIETRNIWAAIDLDDAITRTIVFLAEHPLAGRVGRVNATREFAVTGTPYLVVYRLMADSIVIIRILHGAQDWPPG